MAFFEENGCPLKVERGNRVFPVSDRSADVLAALTGAMRQGGVRQRQETVLGLDIRDGALCGVLTRHGVLPCGTAILCTGGASYPLTGSTGDGYRFARAAGHTVIPPSASLVPMEAEADCAQMQGLSLRNTGMKLLDGKNRVLFEDFGELLFTHFGVSGPMALSASAHLPPEGGCRLILDLKPALDDAKLEVRFLRDLEKYANRRMEHALEDLFPRSMIPVLLRRAGIDPTQRANALTKERRRSLLEMTKHFSIRLLGPRPIEEAVITRGGVCVREVDPKTMRSKLVRGLYFAGEVLDCDAYTGGFNLQIAWSTAYAAATAAVREMRDCKPGRI